MTTESQNAKILIVEDESINAKLLESRVKEYGHIPIGPVATGEAAIEAAQREKPDLVLMDIQLQGDMDGIEAAEIIKEKNHTQIIYVTAHSEEEFLQRAKPTIPHGYILKPFQDKELKITIEMALYAGELDNERRKTEERLRESEKKYRQLFNHAPAGIYDVDFVQNRITSVNDVACHFTGYSRDEILSMDPSDFLGDDSREDFIKRLEAHSQGEMVSDSVVYEIITKSGQSIWALLTINFKQQDNQIVGASVVAHNITDKVQAEKALEESEAKHKKMVANISDVIAIMDSSGIIRYTSPNVEKWFGWHPEDLVGTDGWATVHPEDLVRIQNEFFSLIDKDNVVKTVEYRYKCKDESYKWIELTAVNLTNDSVINGVLMNYCDITDRKQAENALRESKEKYRIEKDFSNAIIDTNHTIIVGLDKQHIIRIFSKGAERITGYSRAEVLGKDWNLLFLNFENQEQLDIVWKSAWEQDYKMFMQSLENRDKRDVLWDAGQENNIYSVTGPLQVRDGTLKMILWQNTRIRMGDDERHHLHISIGVDITDRKRAEEEQIKLASQLQQSQKMEAVGTLAGGIAHDFNNLLQAINGYSQIMLLDRGESDHEYHNLKAIQKAGQRAASLVQQLLQFSRKAETERKPLNLNQEIEQVRRMLERTIPKMIDIEVHPGSHLWTINSDPVQMEQILLNLGTNAADVMPGGGKLVIETENITIDEEYAKSYIGVSAGKYVLLAVSDTGQGMDKETIEHIFEPFFTTKEIGKGTGLGLASVYGIVKSYGGYINCYSEVGQGTTFKIYLPAMEEQKTEPDRQISDERPKGGTETILLVDDESSIRDFASQVLLKFGYSPMTATSGEEALEVYSKHSGEIDLVVIDLGMPGMGGHKCIQELLKINPNINVIIASGYSINGQVKDTLEAGAKGFVGKPYQINELLRKVRDVLDGEE